MLNAQEWDPDERERTRVFQVCVLILCLVAAGYMLIRQPVRHRPGVQVAPEPPVIDTTVKKPPFSFKGYTLTPFAKMYGRSVVVSKLRLWGWGDAVLSPFDLGIGWGILSDQRVRDHYRFNHGYRLLFWEAKDPSALPPGEYGEVGRDFEHLHVIPADNEVFKTMKRIRVGDVIQFDGWVVEAAGPGHFTWSTSVALYDHRCEVLFLTRLYIKERY